MGFLKSILWAAVVMLLLPSFGCKRSEPGADAAQPSASTNSAAITNATAQVPEPEPGVVDTSLDAPFPAPTTNLVWIPPGQFLMGSAAEDPNRNDAEIPQSQALLRRGFWMGKYEVTQGEYQAVVGPNPKFQGPGNLPADSMSWGDATNYCAKLNVAEKQAGRLPDGFAYRLPTEAEWEYAARSGHTNRFSFGDDIGFKKIGRYAWTSENSGNDTHPVGQKAPNTWGLYDLHGNVAEWCQDWFGTYTQDDKTNPTGPATGRDRVYRGGSCADAAAESRVSARGGLNPDSRLGSFGFRVVLAPVAK